MRDSPCAPCVPPQFADQDQNAPNAPEVTLTKAGALAWRHLRNEKVRGSSPLSSTHLKMAFDQAKHVEHRRIRLLSFRLDPRPRPPGGPRTIQTSQSGLVSGRSHVMEVQVRSRNRRVPHPRLHRDRIDSASQPQTRRRMPKIMDPPPLTDRRPIQGRLERRCVQLMGESRSRTGERPGRDQPSSAAPSTGLLPISEDTTVSTRRSPPEKPTECSQREQAAREQRRRINRVRTIDGHAYLLVSTWERSHRPEADAWRPPSKAERSGRSKQHSGRTRRGQRGRRCCPGPRGRHTAHHPVRRTRSTVTRMSSATVLSAVGHPGLRPVHQPSNVPGGLLAASGHPQVRFHDTLTHVGRVQTRRLAFGCRQGPRF